MPWLTVFAGPNGSGKSTLYRHMASAGVDLGETYINADDLAATERDRRIAAGEPFAQSELDLWAFEKAQERRAVALRDRRSFCFETVFSHPSKLDYLTVARAAGYSIRLFFVSTENSRLNVERVAKRVLEGGHNVPVDRILDRYRRVMQLLPDACFIAHETTLFDNSDRSMRAAARIQWDAAGTPVIELRRPIPRWVKSWADQMTERLKRG